MQSEVKSEVNSSYKAIQLHEEVLDVVKERIQTGEVTIHKEVVEEMQTVQIPVSHEEVVIQVKNFNSSSQSELQSNTIRIPVKEEKVDIIKYPIDLEAVDVSIQQVNELQHIDDNLKREEALLEYRQ